MTQDEIIRMAREAGLLTDDEAWVSPYQEAMERFAALVAAHERENSAKMQADCTLAAVLAERERAWTEKDWGEAAEWIRQQEREACAAICDRFAERDMHPAECAAAIRARGEK